DALALVLVLWGRGIGRRRPGRLVARTDVGERDRRAHVVAKRVAPGVAKRLGLAPPLLHDAGKGGLGLLRRSRPHAVAPYQVPCAARRAAGRIARVCRAIGGNARSGSSAAWYHADMKRLLAIAIALTACDQKPASPPARAEPAAARPSPTDHARS